MVSLHRCARFMLAGVLAVMVAGGCSDKKPPEPTDTANLNPTPYTGLNTRSTPTPSPLDNGGTVGPGDPAGLTRVYFDYDSSTLSSEARTTLQADYQTFRNSPSLRVEIEGHTDERGTNEYNQALGQKRANAVKAYLVQLGVTASRVETISYGEELPADMGHDEAAWAKNRRAQFRVLTP